MSEVAGRLRLIQADTAEASADERRELLQEEITRNLKGIPAANRKRYLQALLTRFPVGGELRESSPAAGAAPVAPAQPSKAESAEETIDAPRNVPRGIVRAVLASGLPEAVRADPTVREAYLGDGI